MTEGQDAPNSIVSSLGQVFIPDLMLAAHFVTNGTGQIVNCNILYRLIVEKLDQCKQLSRPKETLLPGPESTEYAVVGDKGDAFWGCFVEDVTEAEGISETITNQRRFANHFESSVALWGDFLEEFTQGFKAEKHIHPSLSKHTSTYVIETTDGDNTGHIICGVRLVSPDGYRASMRHLEESEFKYEYIDIVIAYHVEIITETCGDAVIRRTRWMGMQPAFHDASTRVRQAEQIKVLSHAENYLLSAGALYHKFGRQAHYIEHRLRYVMGILGELDDPNLKGLFVKYNSILAHSETPNKEIVQDLQGIYNIIKQQDMFIAFLRLLAPHILSKSPDPAYRKNASRQMAEQRSKAHDDGRTFRAAKDVTAFYHAIVSQIEDLQSTDIEMMRQRMGLSTNSLYRYKLPATLHKVNVKLKHYRKRWQPLAIHQAGCFDYIMYEYIWNACKHSSLSHSFRISFEVTERNGKDYYISAEIRIAFGGTEGLPGRRLRTLCKLMPQCTTCPWRYATIFPM